MNRTNKNDWFADLLSQDGYIVSGHPSFSNYMGIGANAICTIRIIHKAAFLKIILLIEVPSVDNFDFTFNAKTIDQLYQLFRNDLLIIVFDEVFFSVSTDRGETFKQKSSDELEIFFSEMNIDLTKSKGTFKTINKTYNDNFQTWTRTRLTKYCTVNDIDALSLSDGNIILELKRVEESLENWKPYLDDYYNYSSFYFLAKRFALKARIIAYSAKSADHVALHIITKLDPNKQYVDGQFVMLPPIRAIANLIPEARASLKKYRSTNRRVY